MLKVENRESAHIKSRVKDLSVVPNVVSYTGLFACITPLSSIKPNEEDGTFEPVLIRDTDSLITTFGDPRIDPNKFIDLYSIMQVIGNGTSCYVTKVKSGSTGTYKLSFINDTFNATSWTHEGAVYTSESDMPANTKLTSISYTSNGNITPIKIVDENPETKSQCTFAVVNNKLVVTLGAELGNNETLATTVTVGSTNDAYWINAYSAMEEPLTISASVFQAKPLSLKAFYLKVTITYNNNELAVAKCRLESSTTNIGLVNSLNSQLSPYVLFELVNNSEEYQEACEDKESGINSIVCSLLDKVAPKQQDVRQDINNGETDLVDPSIEEISPTFVVRLSDYEAAYNKYKDKRYSGCLLSDLSAPLSHFYSNAGVEQPANDPFGYPTPDERRSLHFYLKQVAIDRKDATVILSVPYEKNDSGNNEQANRYKVTGTLSKDDVCDWVLAKGNYASLWEYGSTNTTDYAEQSFYLEIYYSWLNMRCTKVSNGKVSAVNVKAAPSNVVVNNILTSFRERGTQYPVAGDQLGVLPDYCSVLTNPKTKADRDQLVQCRINPIYDTGTRGVQIYGNETLNAGYTDLNAAHIARTLVNLRNRIDEYTESIKFSINNQLLWDSWKNYVSSRILEPLKSVNAISTYTVAMGLDTTSPEELANRKINGVVELTFYQSAEIFSLDFVVYSSATAFE